jgi:hypothetical protein
LAGRDQCRRHGQRRVPPPCVDCATRGKITGEEFGRKESAAALPRAPRGARWYVTKGAMAIAQVYPGSHGHARKTLCPA